MAGLCNLDIPICSKKAVANRTVIASRKFSNPTLSVVHEAEHHITHRQHTTQDDLKY
ncbi:hypothetical protein DSUL_100166 [Desulfovibrionales bacterium]